jgi:CubicO group peptidase (beta-lactamase class C family)
MSALRPAVVGTVALLVTAALTACNGAPSSEAPASSGAPAGATASIRVDDGLARDVEDYFRRSYTRGLRDVRAVLVMVDGRTVLQRYRGARPSDTHDAYSVGKSITSTLIGIALAEGKLRSLDMPLSQALPQHAAGMRREVAAITVRQLLTMTAGLPADPPPSTEPLADHYRAWVPDILRRGVERPPGSGFAYSSASSHLLAAILAHATGMPVLEYARRALFDPLGIDTRPAAQPVMNQDPAEYAKFEAAGFAWPTDPQGINTGHGHIKLAPQDMAKIGNLFLNGGTWQGRRIVPAQWVTEATRAHVEASAPVGSHYGYQWWVTTAGDHPAYAAVGFGGQLIEVVPDLRLVVVGATVPGEPTEVIDTSVLQYMVTLAVVPHLHAATGP